MEHMSKGRHVAGARAVDPVGGRARCGNGCDTDGKRWLWNASLYQPLGPIVPLPPSLIPGRGIHLEAKHAALHSPSCIYGTSLSILHEHRPSSLQGGRQSLVELALSEPMLPFEEQRDFCFASSRLVGVKK